MSRRRGLSPERSVLGPGSRNLAYRAVDTYCARAVAAMVPIEFTAENLVNWLIPLDTQRVLKDAHEVIAHNKSAGLHYSVCQQVLLTLGGWDERKMAVPVAAAASSHMFAANAGKVFTMIREVEGILRDYAVVGKVISWLDRQGTNGAFRYYFPSIMALVPGLDLGDANGSHRDPGNVAQMLPLVRAAAATIASSLMLPEREVPGESTARFTFSKNALTYEGVEVTVPPFSMRI